MLLRGMDTYGSQVSWGPKARAVSQYISGIAYGCIKVGAHQFLDPVPFALKTRSRNIRWILQADLHEDGLQ